MVADGLELLTYLSLFRRQNVWVFLIRYANKTLWVIYFYSDNLQNVLLKYFICIVIINKTIYLKKCLILTKMITILIIRKIYIMYALRIFLLYTWKLVKLKNLIFVLLLIREINFDWLWYEFVEKHVLFFFIYIYH